MYCSNKLVKQRGLLPWQTPPAAHSPNCHQRAHAILAEPAQTAISQPVAGPATTHQGNQGRRCPLWGVLWEARSSTRTHRRGSNLCTTQPSSYMRLCQSNVGHFPIGCTCSGCIHVTRSGVWRAHVVI